MKLQVSIFVALAMAALATASPMVVSFNTPSPAKSDVHALEVCLRLCAENKQECPQTWYPKNFGLCWTCCKDPDGALKHGGENVFTVQIDDI